MITPQNTAVPFSVKSQKDKPSYQSSFTRAWANYYDNEYEDAYFGYADAAYKKAMTRTEVKDSEPITSSLVIARKNIKVPNTYKEELRNLLLGGSFELRPEMGPSSRIMVCQKRLIHAIARLMFAQSTSSAQSNWPIVLNQLSLSYRLVFEGLDLDVEFYERQDHFIFFKINASEMKEQIHAHELYEAVAEFAVYHQPV